MDDVHTLYAIVNSMGQSIDLHRSREEAERMVAYYRHTPGIECHVEERAQ